VQVHAGGQDRSEADRPTPARPLRQRGDGEQDSRSEQGQPGVHPSVRRLIGEEGRTGDEQTRHAAINGLLGEGEPGFYGAERREMKALRNLHRAEWLRAF
jgi:hypothetical protein